jgi:glycerophosphoryl diester phosphodiesterase
VTLAVPHPLAPGQPRPLLIAHGGGNSPAAAHAAIAAGADLLEVDLWLHNGRFEARHERRIRFLPFLVETWYLKRLPRSHFGLEELLDLAAASSTGVFLDLKDGRSRTAEALHRLLHALEHHPPVLASSQSWPILRALHEVMPSVDLFYSIDVRAKLDLFLSVSEREPLPRGVSCRHALLTRPIVDELRRRGLAVVAWTVDDIERAEQLADWGVDAITTHRIAELRAVLRPAS